MFLFHRLIPTTRYAPRITGEYNISGGLRLGKASVLATRAPVTAILSAPSALAWGGAKEHDLAYMRGDTYIWRGTDGFHFWVSNGYDSWDCSVWAVDTEGKRDADRIAASGVSVPDAAIDEFVVMRLAELLEDGQLAETVSRALGAKSPRGGNFGSDALRRQAAALLAALNPPALAPPALDPPALDRSALDPPALAKENEAAETPKDNPADAPYALQDAAERERRLPLVREPHMLPLSELVQEIRLQTGRAEGIPFFDPCDGGIHARALFLLEAPGPKAVDSFFVSRNNPDPTAGNLSELMTNAGIARTDTLLWNVVPWYLGDGGLILPAKRSEITEAAPYLKRLIDLLPRLEVVVLIGKKAQSAEPEIKRLTRVPIYFTHHMSARVFNIWPEKRAETQAVFNQVAALLAAKK